MNVTQILATEPSGRFLSRNTIDESSTLSEDQPKGVELLFPRNIDSFNGWLIDFGQNSGNLSVIEILQNYYRRFFVPTVPDYSFSEIIGTCLYLEKNEAKEPIIRQLNEYLSLEENWDGYGGIVPSEQAVEDAISFLKSIPHDLPLPKPMVSGDGEVGLYWKSDNTFIDLEFSGNQSVTYYARGNDGVEHFGEDHPLANKEVPDGILETLRKM